MEFYRIKNLPPYVFAEVNELKAKARKAGKDIIDFGMGNPDGSSPKHVVEKLRQAVLDKRTHRYSVSQGIPGLRKAVSTYYERRFGVSLNPDKEIVATIGSKEGLASLATAISKPGDIVLVQNPSYPIHPFGFIIVGASVQYMPVDFTVDNHEAFVIKQIKESIENAKKKPLAVVVNYPCNPTSQVVSLDFYKELVEICHRHGVIIISDLAYCEIYFDDNPPPSVLQVKKARDIAIEFTTLSKTYSMAGWRMGFACGNEELIYALRRIKSYLDYGAFAPVQIAAAVALNGPQDCVEDNRRRYKRRRDILVKGLNDAGWKIDSPKASMFIWAPIPEKFLHLGSLKFSKLLLEKADVAVSPGVGFGEHGDGHVRISMIENEHRTRQAVRNIKAFLR